MDQSEITLLVGGHIYSPTHPDATALAICGETICWIGSDDIGRERFPHAHHQDLAGAFVAPGFVDSHVHVLEIGLRSLGLDLSSARSAQHCLDLIRQYSHEQTGLLWGYGWDDTLWDYPRPIYRQELDEATQGKHAFFLHHHDSCALVSTSLAHQIHSLHPFLTQYPYAAINGQHYNQLYHIAVTQLSPHQRHQAHQACINQALASGIVALHECGTPTEAGIDDFRLLCSNNYPIDLFGYWAQIVTTCSQAHELINQTGAIGLGGEIYIDGSLESHDAFLSSPYHDHPNQYGSCYLTKTQIIDHLRACTEAGISAGFHVIGDRGIAIAIEAFSYLVDRYGIPAVARCGHRLEQASMIHPNQCNQLGTWGIKCTICLTTDYNNQYEIPPYTHQLGLERARNLSPLLPLAHAGVPLSFRLNSPHHLFNPWETLYAATHHPNVEYSLSMRGAFTAATRGGWRAGGIDDELIGTLVVGAPASYVIWEVDELGISVPRNSVQRWSLNPQSRIPPLPILTTPKTYPRCRQTVHRGKQLYG